MRQPASVLAAAILVLGAVPSVMAADYWVATGGNDSTGDGSQGNPWRTIQYAVNQGIPAGGGDTVIVRDGVYEEMNTIQRGFANPVIIRAENPYRVTLTNVSGGMEAIRIYYDGEANITIEGFVITNAHDTYTCPNGREPYYLIHIQDASNVMLYNNVIFGNNAPGTCNEVVKINRGGQGIYVRGIVIRGNVLYDPANAGGSDIIDSVRPGEIDIEDNIFWGNPSGDRSQSFITLKRQAPAVGTPRSPRYRIVRNVFLNYGGATDQAFVQFGEDGVPEPEITDALVENNLFIGNSPAQMAAPMQFKGPREIRVQFNTVVGDLPSGSFGFRVGTEGSNPTIQDIWIRNNIFADPTGTMTNRFFNAYGDVDLSSVELARNLFWNNGGALPTTGDLLPTDDALAITDDPELPADQSGLILPEWDSNATAFISGSTTIREEFLRLVEAYGSIPSSSAAVDVSDGNAPLDDIRGLARDNQPDVGAYEYGADTPQPQPDGGLPTSDGGGPSSDGGTPSADGSDVDGGGSAGSSKSGCGCRTSGRSAFPLPLLLAFLLLLFTRRKNRW